MVARAAIGAMVVVVLVVRTGIDTVRDAIAHADPAGIAAAFAVLLVALVVNAFRWRVFLRPLRMELSVRESVRLTFIGTFFNAFLPTGVGGDAYKSMSLRTTAGSLPPPLATVFLDRLAGLVGLAALGLAGDTASGGRPSVTVAVLLAGIAILGASLIALASSRGRTAPEEHAPGFGSRLRAFAGAFATASRQPGVIGAGAALGIVSALILVAVHVILAASLGLSMPLAAWPGIVLIATLTTMVPVTINGLGFREAAYVWCLGAYGIARNDALAFAVLVLVVTLASSAVGGVVYVLAGGGRSERMGLATSGSRARPGPTPRSAG
jgi:hypothetical protein